MPQNNGRNTGASMSNEQRADLYRSTMRNGSQSASTVNKNAKNQKNNSEAKLNDVLVSPKKRQHSSNVMVMESPVRKETKSSKTPVEMKNEAKKTPVKKPAVAAGAGSSAVAAAPSFSSKVIDKIGKSVNIKRPNAPEVDNVWFKNRGKFDLPMFILVMILLVMGLVMMTSASYTYSLQEQADSFTYSKQQIFGAIIGFFGMIVFSRLDYHVFIRPFHGDKVSKKRKTEGNGANLSKLLFVISCFLMVAVLLFGESVSDAKRWITIFGLQFQPSEIMKLSAILLTAYILQRYYDVRKNVVYGFAIHLYVIGFCAILCILQRHVSALVIICLVVYAMMFVAGSNRYCMIALIALGVLGALFLLYVAKWEYLTDRINCFLNPMSDIGGDTYQTYQSLVTIGSGGWFGLGLGNSRQKYFFLPESQNDFVFSIICEELGFIGGITIVLLFIILIFRGLYIASKAKDKFGSFVALGITIQIGLQALLNIAVSCNAIPNTGISLPFFSFGRTALVIQLIEMGILLSVSRQSDT